MPKNIKDLTLSVIITAHTEGLLAHKTMLSVQGALKSLGREITHEIIVSIDNGDEATRSYFDRYRDHPGHSVLEVSFKDLSASRNNAVKHARGQFITFLDADDLVSANWLNEALTIAESDNKVIVHPEFSITFGDHNLVWRKRDSSNLSYDTLRLVDNNLWDSPCLAAKSVFIQFPYYAIGSGVGYEDKHFNCETLANGIRHVVAPETVLYVRRKSDGSLLTQSSSSRVTVAKTKLLSYDAVRSLTLPDNHPEQQPANPLTKRAARKLARHSKAALLKVHSRAIQHPAYARSVKKLREKRQQKIIADVRGRYPEAVLDSWKDIHKIENQLFPAKELLKHVPWYNSENTAAGYVYANVLKKMSRKPDTLFFVPHLIKGGADKVFVNYLHYLGEVNPSWRITMLQTEAARSVWADKVPHEVDFINFSEASQTIDRDASFRVLATLVNQLDIKRIIIGNAQLAYDFAAAYKTLLEALDIKIYCFAFGEEFDDEGRLWGLVHTGIPKIYPQIYKIITDNNNIVTKLEREYAFDPTKFHVHYQPTDLDLRDTNVTANPTIRVLWASRVCKQKRPDILKAVSKKLDPERYSIDAFGQLEDGLTPSYFADSQVNYRGAFNGAESLPTKEYDIFLYTSEGDGVPNMLQEMTALGLPIVASNVGGIKEFIKDRQTGRLILDHELIDDYVSAIEDLSSPTLRQEYNRNAQQLLRTTFSKAALLKKVAQDFDK